MPVGTGFEYSAMKTSFSLSSLQAPDITTPEREIKSRQFNSLTKKRVKSPNVRKSWGSTTSSDHRDDFWSSLQENYNYIMDNHLIDKCQEVKHDIALDRNEREQTLDDFIAEYSKLYTLVDSVQEMIYGKEENITDKAIRLQCQSLVLEHSPVMNLLNETAGQLVQSHPEVQDEVTWRLGHLNSKWDTISNILGGMDCGLCEQDTCLDLDHEIKCLRKWIKTMEQALQPLDLKTKYSKTEIEAKALELKVLHRDIENHGKIVGSVVKLCKKSDASCNRANVRRIANGLERRWHLLFLSSLEWQCYLDSLAVRENSKNQSYSSDSDSDFSFEPANKYPRLSSREYQSPNKDQRDKQNVVELPTRAKSPEEVMTTNALPVSVEQNGFDTLDGQIKPGGTEDHFTHSNRKGPNLATYYFKHPDTDSDMDKVEKVSIALESTQETSEEDEWVYTSKNEEKGSQDTDTNGNSDSSKKKIPDETIKRLVQKAEELVSPDQTKKLGKLHAFNKMSRVKQWLKNKKPEDSCDASGEDEERESQLSEEMDESTATYKATPGNESHNTSFTELNSSESTPKVMLRQRKYNGNRPWSVSCILQLETTKNGMDQFSHSTSESALHNITPKKIEFNNTSSTQTIILAGNNSTSSTIEDSNTILPEEKTSPNRRRRMKTKRKCNHKFQCNKSDERCLNNRLFKSSSYSGCSNAMNGHSDRQTSSDPPSMSLHSFGKYDTTSGADTDDSIGKRGPTFKVGQKTNYLNSEVRDSSPGKSSLNTAEEQSSSLSEQAWDSYQEKYMSEAYSEAHDSDAARRLLEFGEDYRNFIDSQSDWSTNPDFSPTFRRRTLPFVHQNQNVEECDTDSDPESLRKFINSSRDQLNYTKEIHQQQVQLGLGQYLETNNINEMLATCERHIDLLNHIDRSGDCVSRDDKKSATDEKEVASMIKELKKEKSPGWDGITTTTLKNISNNIVSPLAKLINKSMNSGIYPEILKTSVVVPIYKSGDRKNLSNYRPVSLTSTLTKIYEKILKKRLCTFLEKYKILSDKQFGFQKNKSAQDAIARLVAIISDAIDRRIPALCVFVDLAKAFDTVEHNELLRTLESIGCRGLALNLIESYLKGRHQIVKIGNEKSIESVITYGVPQGTVLGPILFLIYVNDFFQCGAGGEITSFADDTAIFFRAPTWKVLEENAQRGLSRVFQFFRTKKLTVNFEKTKFMTFASYKNYLPTYTKLLIPNDHSHVELQKTNSTKYLGVLIDTHLRWDLHSDLVSKRIRLLINKFKFLRQICTINELKMVYHALVEPHLTYGILGWGGLSDIYYKRMEITQKWIIKIMYRKTITYPTLDLYEIADVFTIRQLYARSLLIHQHSVKPEVPENEQKYELRSISSIPIPKANKTIGLKVFTYLAPLLYRKLPPNIRKNINIGAYKRQIKIWIKTNSKIEWNKFFNRYRHT